LRKIQEIRDLRFAFEMKKHEIQPKQSVLVRGRAVFVQYSQSVNSRSHMGEVYLILQSKVI
jgi:hypothetical protein